MADNAYGVTKVYGFTNTGYESITSNFEFITLSSTVDIRTASAGSAASQAALDKLIQVVSERGQPVIMGSVAGTVSPWVVILAVEHPKAWQCVQGVSGVQLADRIANDGINYGFTPGAVTVTFSDVLT